MSEHKWTKPTQYKGYPWPEIIFVVGIAVAALVLSIVVGA